MSLLVELNKHPLYGILLEDSKVYLSQVKYQVTDTELKDDLDELQYYIHAVGFSFVHLIKWCQQLDYAIEFLFNFNYSKNFQFVSYNRIDHLIYNIENYIIRFHSLDDRILQLINKVFHLTVAEEEVSSGVILTNYKVSRTNVPKLYKPLKNHILKFNENRNILIHRHSLLESELRKLELFYYLEYESEKEDFIKQYRIKRLKEFLKKENIKLKTNNEKTFDLIYPLFSGLQNIYIKEKKRLELIVK